MKGNQNKYWLPFKFQKKENKHMKFYRKNFDLEEKRIRGLITDEMYYILKRKEAVGDYYKQKELISL